MSAFKVENKTINKIVSWLCYEQYNKSAPTYGKCSQKLFELGYQDINILDEKMLCADMHALNEYSLHQRYSEAQSMYNNEREYTPTGRCTLPEVYKAISCWMYQSCEGDCTQRPLYKAFEKIKNIMANAYIGESKEYDAANWG